MNLAHLVIKKKTEKKFVKRKTSQWNTKRTEKNALKKIIQWKTKKNEKNALKKKLPSEPPYRSHKKNRKEYIQLELEELKSKNKNDKLYIVGQDEFDKVRDICRFESVRIDIMKSSPVSGLYSIYLLRKKYIDNFYLDLASLFFWLMYYVNI